MNGDSSNGDIKTQRVHHQSKTNTFYFILLQAEVLDKAVLQSLAHVLGF